VLLDTPPAVWMPKRLRRFVCGRRWVTAGSLDQLVELGEGRQLGRDLTLRGGPSLPANPLLVRTLAWVGSCGSQEVIVQRPGVSTLPRDLIFATVVASRCKRRSFKTLTFTNAVSHDFSRRNDMSLETLGGSMPPERPAAVFAGDSAEQSRGVSALRARGWPCDALRALCRGGDAPWL
jgi:hypothetical protein